MARWTAEDVTRLEVARAGRQAATKPSKYRNVKTVIGTEKFDSGREAAYWQGLLARVKAGEIRNLSRQVEFPLYCPVRTPKGAGYRQVALYICDFMFEERDGEMWSWVVADAKGVRTQTYALKKKWLELQERIVIREV